LVVTIRGQNKAPTGRMYLKNSRRRAT
jgi:hypothetical protein